MDRINAPVPLQAEQGNLPCDGGKLRGAGMPLPDNVNAHHVVTSPSDGSVAHLAVKESNM